MKTILITGSKGFIGQYMVKKLSNDFDIIPFDRSHGDISDENTFKELSNKSIDHIFHLAALTFVPESWEHPAKYTTINISGLVNVLELAKSNGASVTFLSSYLYGNPKSLPINEEAEIEALNPYALSKVLAEQVCKFYFDNFNIACTVVRPFNVYGPGQKNHFLIPIIINDLLFNDYVQVKTLTPKRDYLFIDDLINALHKTITISKDFQIINIGYGKSYSVGEVIETAMNLIGKHIEVKSETNIRKNEIMDVVADIEKAKNLLSWSPKIDLKVGLKKCIDSYQQQNEK